MQKGDKRYNNLRSAFFPLQKWRDVGRGSRFAPLQPQHFRYVSNQPYWLRPFSFTTTVGFVYPFVHSRLMKGKAPFGSNNPIYSCFLSTGSGRFIFLVPLFISFSQACRLRRDKYRKTTAPSQLPAALPKSTRAATMTKYGSSISTRLPATSRPGKGCRSDMAEVTQLLVPW